MAYRDRAPTDPTLTDYDREHLVLYLRLLDAAEDGADWREVVQVLFDVDPTTHPERARLMHQSHLEHARWFSSEGYRDLLRQG
jgi:hypothetical protein